MANGKSLAFFFLFLNRYLQSHPSMFNLFYTKKSPFGSIKSYFFFPQAGEFKCASSDLCIAAEKICDFRLIANEPLAAAIW